jgi:hypothetical protein
MNNLEKIIIDAGKTAQKDYEAMTDGWWLSHGPESFIQHTIASKVKEAGFWVYPEASPKKIRKEQNDPPRGRPPRNLDQRFDLVVWYKTSNNIRAILEIKRVWSIWDLRGDREKIEKFLKLKNNENVMGYLLAYTEATEADGNKRADRLSKRLKNWAEKLNCTLAGIHIDGQGDGEWGWAIGLFRLLRL